MRRHGPADPAVAAVQDNWAHRVLSGQMTPGTAARYTRILAAFTRFAFAHDCSKLAEVDGPLCAAFVHAPCKAGNPPATSTSRFRLTVIREAFAVIRAADNTTGDPTEGLRVVQSARIRTVCPITPGEASRLRYAARLSPRDRIRPAVVELALLGATHAEVAASVVANLDLRSSTISIAGRQLELDAFATSTFTARVAACRRTARSRRQPWDPATTPLALTRHLDAYPATSIAPSISSSLSRAMTAAGLTREGLRPASLREFAANRQYALTGRVESVAERLGIDSLDVARSLIDSRWQQQHAEEVRG